MFQQPYPLSSANKCLRSTMDQSTLAHSSVQLFWSGWVVNEYGLSFPRTLQPINSLFRSAPCLLFVPRQTPEHDVHQTKPRLVQWLGRVERLLLQWSRVGHELHHHAHTNRRCLCDHNDAYQTMQMILLVLQCRSLLPQGHRLSQGLECPIDERNWRTEWVDINPLKRALNHGHSSIVTLELDSILFDEFRLDLFIIDL